MYRGLAVHFLKKGLCGGDKNAVIDACDDAKVTIGYENGIQQIYLNGENITEQLRTEKVGNMASKTSVIPEVRAKLLELQRSLAREKDVIMDGRDIGTNILPDADVKIYLTASVETRAKRRYEELSAKGEHITLEKIMTDIKERDHRDMTREVAPLKQAEDAILVIGQTGEYFIRTAVRVETYKCNPLLFVVLETDHVSLKLDGAFYGMVRIVNQGFGLLFLHSLKHIVS